MSCYCSKIYTLENDLAMLKKIEGNIDLADSSHSTLKAQLGKLASATQSMVKPGNLSGLTDTEQNLHQPIGHRIEAMRQMCSLKRLQIQGKLARLRISDGIWHAEQKSSD